MKWIGQQIYDQIVRFRNQVFFEADTVTFTSANADDPQVIIENTTNDDQGSRLILQKLRADDAVATGQNLGEIWFTGQDNGQNFEEYAYIIGEIDVSTHGQESGKLQFGVAAHDGTNQPGLILTGGSVSTEVDATIGIGAASVTTIAGTLTMGSTAAMTNAGLLSVAAQTNITSLGTLTALNVDDINLNAKTITVTGDTDDTFSITSGAAGATTIATTDAEEAGAHLTLQPDGELILAPVANNFKFYNPSNTSDYFNATIGTHGDVKFNTVDAAAAAAHFEVEADGNITLDAAGDIVLEAGGDDLTLDADNFTFTSSTSAKPYVEIIDSTADASGSRFVFNKNRGAAGQDADLITAIQFKSYNDAGTPELINYGQILPKIHDASDGTESGQLIFQVQAHGGGNETGLTLTGGSQDDEVDVDIGLGTSSQTSVKGTLDIAGNNLNLAASASITIDDTNIISDSSGTATLSNIDALDATTEATIETAIDTLSNLTAASSLVTVGTIGTGVWQGTAIASAYIADDAVTFAKASGVTPNVYGNIIKLIPSDFMANDDGGNTKFGVGYVESAGALYGMRTANNATELFAFVSIPEGMKATHVDIFDKNDLAVEVFEAQINATTMTSKGSGNANTQIDITDVNSTATNFLAIQVTTTAATNDKVYGGQVTIAAI